MRKKLTQLLVCFFVLAAALGTVYASAASDSVLGDVNGDGNVNVLDYALLKRYVMGIGKLPEDGQAVADVNKDGKINAIDYARVKGHVLGTFDIHLDQHLFLQ